MFESVSDDVAEDLRRNLVELLAGSIVIVEIRERVAKHYVELVQAELVTREVDETDRRRVLVRPKLLMRPGRSTRRRTRPPFLPEETGWSSSIRSMSARCPAAAK